MENLKYLYKAYKNAGFKREDYEDSVVYDKTGHNPFLLKHKVNKNSYICVVSGDLSRPNLCIDINKKEGTIHRVLLTINQALAIVKENK